MSKAEEVNFATENLEETSPPAKTSPKETAIPTLSWQEIQSILRDEARILARTGYQVKFEEKPANAITTLTVFAGRIRQTMIEFTYADFPNKPPKVCYQKEGGRLQEMKPSELVLLDSWSISDYPSAVAIVGEIISLID